MGLREDSKLRMAESKSKWFALFVNAHSEKMLKFDLNPIKRLGGFGMQGRVAPCCDAPRPPKAEVTRSKSCRARQRINGLAGPATKSEKKASSDRFMHVPPGRRSNSLLS